MAYFSNGLIEVPLLIVHYIISHCTMIILIEMIPIIDDPQVDPLGNELEAPRFYFRSGAPHARKDSTVRSLFFIKVTKFTLPNLNVLLASFLSLTNNLDGNS